jgi:hypothetical protein
MQEDNQEIVVSKEDTYPDILVRAMEAERESGADIKNITADKLQKAARQLRLLETGHHASFPMRCAGVTCPMQWNCPLMKAGFVSMLAEPCPIERDLLKRWTDAYILGLQVDVNNPVEVGMAADLAETDLFARRAKDRMAYEDFIIKQAVAVDDDGMMQYRSELSPAAIWEDMLFKRKMKIREAFLSTRKAIAEAGGGASTDAATSMSKVRALMDKAKKNLARQDSDIRAAAAKEIPTEE